MEILGILSICNILFCALLFKCSCYVNAVCCTKHRGGTYLRINNSLFCQESTWLNFLVVVKVELSFSQRLKKRKTFTLFMLIKLFQAKRKEPSPSTGRTACLTFFYVRYSFCTYV